MKTCRKCKSQKPLSEFYIDRNNKDGRRNSCIECDKIYKRTEQAHANSYKYYHSEKGKAAERRYRESEKYKETCKTYSQSFGRLLQRMINGSRYSRKYSQSEKGKQRETERRNSAKRKAYREEYRKRPDVKERERIYGLNSVHKRLAIAKGLPSTFTEKDWRNALDYFDHCCAYCGKRKMRLERDHFIPLSAGGSYTSNNIVPACKSCNISKYNNMPEDWCRPADIKRINSYFASLKKR